MTTAEGEKEEKRGRYRHQSLIIYRPFFSSLFYHSSTGVGEHTTPKQKTKLPLKKGQKRRKGWGGEKEKECGDGEVEWIRLRR